MRRRTALCLEPLEARDVPAGDVIASVSRGTLTLTGDDFGNSVELLVTPTGVTVTGVSTSVNGQPELTAVPFGPITSIRAQLVGGDDFLRFNAASDLTSIRSATIDLGDGSNTFYLQLTGKLTLGGLTYIGSDGQDNLRISAGAGLGSRIGGTTSLNFGGGGSSTTITNVDLLGLKATAGPGDDRVELDHSKVAKAVTALLGDGDNNRLGLTASQAASVLARFAGGSVDLDGSTLTGGLTGSFAVYPDVELNSSTVGGTVKVTTSSATVGDAILRFVGSGTVGAVAMDTAGQALFNATSGSSYTIARDMTVRSRSKTASVNFGGTLTVRRLMVSGLGASVGAYGAAQLNVLNNLTVTTPTGGASLSADGGAIIDVNGSVQLNAKSNSAFISLAGASKLDVAGSLTSWAATALINGASSLIVGRDIVFSTQARLVIDRSTVTARNLSAPSKPGYAALIVSGTSNVALSGDVTLMGDRTAEMTQSGGSISVGGAMKVSSRDNTLFQQSGANSTLDVGRGLTVSASGGATTFNTTGQHVNVEGNTKILGSAGLALTWSTIDRSTVNGDLASSRGEFGLYSAQVANLTVAANLQFNSVPALASGRMSIGLTDVSVGKNLSIATGSAEDDLTLRKVQVTGNTLLRTGDSKDLLTIDDSTFTGTFMADLGKGDNQIAIAQAAGSTTPVTFVGKATIVAGRGNDTLQLGRLAGDANSKVVFQASTSTVSGGTGVNTFDDELGLFEGLILGTGLMNWTDPTA